jgi:large repetitive protein
MIKLGTKRRARRMLLPLLMTATAVVFLAPQAHAATTLMVTKTAVPPEDGSVAAGGTINYSIAIQNSGVEDATNVTLTDGTPANTTFVDDSADVDGSPIAGGNPFTAGYNLGTVAASTTMTVTFDVTVDSPLSNGTQITNSASVTADNADGLSDLSDDANHTVASAPALTIDKTSVPPEGGPVLPGASVDYTIVVTNNGTDVADNPVLTDDTPANTTYETGSATVDDGTSINAATNPFVSPGLLLADIPAGGSTTATFSVTVDGPPLANNTPVNNSASVTASNNPTVSNDANLTVASTPGLTVDKTATPAEGGPVVPGDTVTYTITVANDPLATDTATGVELTDPTPANTAYVAGSATIDDGTVIDPATNPFEAGLPVADLAPGDTTVASFQVTVNTPLDNGTQVTNTATVASDQLPDATDDAVHTVQSAPVLTLAKTSAPAETGKVTPGTTVTYSIALTNDATATEVAHNVTLQDPTPTNMVYVSGSARLNGTSVEGDPNPLANPYPLPDLQPGDTQTFTFDMKVVSPLANGTVVSNVAKMTADDHPDLEDAATHTVDSAAVLKVSADSLPKPESKVDAGQTVTFDTKVENDPAATDSLRNVLVAIPTPEGTSFVEGSLKVDGATPVTLRMAAPSSNPLSAGYSLGTMAPGTSHTLSFKAKVKSSAGTITATRTVTADGITAVTATSTLDGPNSGGGGGGGNGSGDGDGTAAEGGAVSATSDELAFTGIELARLLLLAMSLLLAGWTLFARGRVLQRRAARVTASDTGDTGAGLPILDRWAEAWFYPDSKK